MAFTQMLLHDYLVRRRRRETPTISVEFYYSTSPPTDTNGSELAGPEIIAEIGESSTEVYRGTIILNSTNATEGTLHEKQNISFILIESVSNERDKRMCAFLQVRGDVFYFPSLHLVLFDVCRIKFRCSFGNQSP